MLDEVTDSKLRERDNALCYNSAIHRLKLHTVKFHANKIKNKNKNQTQAKRWKRTFSYRPCI